MPEYLPNGRESNSGDAVVVVYGLPISTLSLYMNSVWFESAGSARFLFDCFLLFCRLQRKKMRAASAITPMGTPAPTPILMPRFFEEEV